jgi:hypothetical protein
LDGSVRIARLAAAVSKETAKAPRNVKSANGFLSRAVEPDQLNFAAQEFLALLAFLGGSTVNLQKEAGASSAIFAGRC